MAAKKKTKKVVKIVKKSIDIKARIVARLEKSIDKRLETYERTGYVRDLAIIHDALITMQYIEGRSEIIATRSVKVETEVEIEDEKK